MKASRCALFIFVLTLLTACDSFSLKTELITPKDLASSDIKDNPPPPPSNLSLTTDKIRLTEGQTANLTLSGGVGPYEPIEIRPADILAYTPADPETRGEVSQTGGWKYTAGAEIGTVRLTLTDNQGTQTYVDIDVVPEPVTDIIAVIDPVNDRKVDLAWTCRQADRITFFKILLVYGTKGSETFVIMADAVQTVYAHNHVDFPANFKNTDITVTITAVAEAGEKTYESQPATAVAPAAL